METVDTIGDIRSTKIEDNPAQQRPQPERSRLARASVVFHPLPILGIPDPVPLPVRFS